jgi:hypothetical protein
VKKPVLFTAAMATTALAFSLTIIPAQAQVAPVTSAVQTASAAPTSAEGGALYEQIQDLLPADYQSRVAAVNQRLGLAPDFGQALFQPVINPGDYQCSGSELQTWVQNTADQLGDTNVFNAVAGMIMTEYYALLFESGSTPQTFGVNGEYTTTLDHTFKDLKRFWDLPDGPQIQMVPMHGSILTDPYKVARVFKVLLGVTDQDALNGGQRYAEVFNTPTFDYGAHPLLTLNSFAWEGAEVDLPGIDRIPPKILMGDGISDVLRDFGLGDVAPQAILAHEFGHQVQYAYGETQTDLTGAEASRRLELMADAYSAYYLTHAQGGHILWKRVADFEKAFADIGDCSFTSASHHGTPNQRMKAAEWGYHLAEDAQKQGHVIPGDEFGKLFDAALPSLTAPDAN